MDRMMKSMTVKPSGDVDSDFVNMMEPHHQGAIDMAVLELRYGKNQQLRRIAQEIIIDQQQGRINRTLLVGVEVGKPLFQIFENSFVLLDDDQHRDIECIQSKAEGIQKVPAEVLFT